MLGYFLRINLALIIIILGKVHSHTSYKKLNTSCSLLKFFIKDTISKQTKLGNIFVEKLRGGECPRIDGWGAELTEQLLGSGGRHLVRFSLGKAVAQVDMEHLISWFWPKIWVAINFSLSSCLLHPVFLKQSNNKKCASQLSPW